MNTTTVNPANTTAAITSQNEDLSVKPSTEKVNTIPIPPNADILPTETVAPPSPSVTPLVQPSTEKVAATSSTVPNTPPKDIIPPPTNRNNSLKPIALDGVEIVKEASKFSPMVPIEETDDGKGYSNIMVIGSEIIHVTHPGQTFRSQGGFNVLYIGSSEKELRNLYGVKSDQQLCAMQRAFGVRYMYQKPAIETSMPPCAIQEKDIVLQALKTRLQTLGHQLSVVPDNLVKGRYLVQKKYLQDIISRIESTTSNSKPCPVVEKNVVSINRPELPDMKGIFDKFSKKGCDCLENLQLLQQFMMIMMLLLGSVSDKEVHSYLDQIPLEKILEIARTSKPSRSNLTIIQEAIDSLYKIYMKNPRSVAEIKQKIMVNTGSVTNATTPRVNDSKEQIDLRDNRIRQLEAELEAARQPSGINQSSQTRIRQLEAELEAARQPSGINRTNEPIMGIEDVLPTTLTPDIYQQVSEADCTSSAVTDFPLDYFTKIEIVGDGACLYSSLYYAYIHNLSLRYPENEEYRRLVQEAREKSSRNEGSKIPTGELQRYFDILGRIFDTTQDMNFCHVTGKIRYEDVYNFNPREGIAFNQFMRDTLAIENNMPKEYSYADIHGFMFALQSHFHVRVYERRTIPGRLEDYNLVYSTEIHNIPNIKGYLNILKDNTTHTIPSELNKNLETNLRSQGYTNSDIKGMSSNQTLSIDHYHVLFPRQLENTVESVQGEGEEIVQIRNIYAQLRPLFEDAGIAGLVNASEIDFLILMDYINQYMGIMQTRQMNNVQRVGENISAKNAEITRLREELQEARNQATQTGTTSSAKNTRIAELEGQLQEARNQATQTGTTSSAKNTRIAELEQERDALLFTRPTNVPNDDINIEEIYGELQAVLDEGTNTSPKNIEIRDLRTRIEDLQQQIEEFEDRDIPEFNQENLQNILSILLTDEGLRNRAVRYIQGRENTDLITNLGNFMQRNDTEVCNIYNILQSLIETQGQFFHTLNNKTYNLDGDIFKEYFNTVPTYDNKALLQELVSIIRDTVTLRTGGILTTQDLPILSSIINSGIKTTKSVQYNGLITEFKTLYNKHKFMISSIKSSSPPGIKLQIGTIEPSTTNTYIPGILFYIRFVQLSKQFLDDNLRRKCNPTTTVEESVYGNAAATAQRLPRPIFASPPPSRSVSPLRGSYSSAVGASAPYSAKKSDVDLYRR